MRLVLPTRLRAGQCRCWRGCTLAFRRRRRCCDAEDTGAVRGCSPAGGRQRAAAACRAHLLERQCRLRAGCPSSDCVWARRTWRKLGELAWALGAKRAARAYGAGVLRERVVSASASDGGEFWTRSCAASEALRRAAMLRALRALLGAAHLRARQLGGVKCGLESTAARKAGWAFAGAGAGDAW